MKGDQSDLFGRRKFVRGSRTSELAAIEAEPSAGTQRFKVWQLLRDFPNGLSDDQMQRILNMNPSTQRPRRVELVEAGLVVDSGRRRHTPSGREAVIWRARTHEELKSYYARKNEGLGK